MAKIGVITFCVLYNDQKNGLQIIANEHVENVTLVSADVDPEECWNSIITTLNGKAMSYLGSLGRDARCVGSIPTINLEGKFGEKNSESAVKTFGNFQMKGTDSNFTSGDINNPRDWEALYLAGCRSFCGHYWIASRYIIETGSAQFCGRVAASSGAYFDRSYYLFYSYEGQSPTSLGVDCSSCYELRPCVLLDSNVKVIRRRCYFRICIRILILYIKYENHTKFSIKLEKNV